MKVTITPDHFKTEEEAVAEIEERGWHALALDVPPEDEELHWHEFNAMLFVVDGAVVVEYEDGSRDSCGPGTRIEAPAGIVHRGVSDGYRMVFGSDVDPAAMSQPINKPLDELER